MGVVGSMGPTTLGRWEQVGRLGDAIWTVTYAPPESIRVLQELADACRPYLTRKKGTPRADCARLNAAYGRAMEVLGITLPKN